ncbi:D-alanyl-D-alanine carboxypeptidase/D-alanyl-D-alanine-endopeptidase [Parabacteroides sp. 52]|uniref:D-alanyl-D-alanine carboxypeptidase/D-alanyl-D-alanine endopeptidase n=1 Tax=unclassified Parabacteroides TaxID=2649774 RepID=UPI0013D23D25|nr:MULTISPECIES: D-alanyl-D-alanine carboxypeptidase/D-alanyl-D-alanine-endopeptidase [unclassified Parabacteroides]MDH6535445.1 D-alanyl-D-alanine carboxypeptidase/D-alanyl-D-alanine-endopeptidase (penicillin-binding protein 4) [Parabacteroides sp. PM5-20]NDV56088.1 D-alanyl-D-alanine carboxypeptidase/D-alanyl-D-alanine-endopeptidase [Parabacteroides sp. 52]
MIKKICSLLLVSFYILPLIAQVPQPLKQLLKADSMKGASFSLIAKEVETGSVLYSYDADRQVTPASILKTVTTATALEVFGPDYRFPTTLAYDGELKDGILYGNLYITGSGDPTLGSAHFTSDRYLFLRQWVEAIRKAGIKEITGSVISDESIFDTEGISPKCLHEDMGSYYGAGSYGLNVFDNLYQLHLTTGKPGDRPVIQSQTPPMPTLRFHNYLTSASYPIDSAFILGGPYSPDRYLYGVVPPNRPSYVLKGDIPDPALFLAGLLHERLQKEGLLIGDIPSCYRQLDAAGQWHAGEKTALVTTYSPPLRQIVRVTNEKSHNLYADALLKTLGLQYDASRTEVLSSFGKGVRWMQSFWKKKGIDTSSLHIYDGSGLAVTNRLSAAFIADVLVYMATQSPQSEAFIQSLPQAGLEGTVRNFLRGSSLQGRTRLKSGGMSRVKCYAGYIDKDGKRYAVALFANNYNCEGREITRALERLLTALF